MIAEAVELVVISAPEEDSIEYHPDELALLWIAERAAEKMESEANADCDL